MTAGGLEHYERRTREEIARTKGVQDHEAGFFTKLVFWHTKRRYGHVLLSIRISRQRSETACPGRVNELVHVCPRCRRAKVE
jgi:hypothetical protein